MFKKVLKKIALISMSAIMCIGVCSVNGSNINGAENFAAKVNSQTISMDKYKAALVMTALQYEYSNQKSLWGDTKNIEAVEESTITNVINSQIQADKATKMGIKFESSQQSVLDSNYSSVVDQYSQYFGAEFTNALSKINISQEQFNKELKDSMKQELIIDNLKKKVVVNCKPTFTKKQIQNEYMLENETVTAKHILILSSKHKDADAKKIANEVLAKLKKGEKFDDLVSKYSEDTGSVSNSGSVGSFTRGQMVKSFEDAAFSLKIGVPSGLVKSQYGYHIIMVQSHMIPDISKMSDETDKQMADNLKAKSQNDYYNKQVAKWIKEAKVSKNNYKLTIK